MKTQIFDYRCGQLIIPDNVKRKVISSIEDIHFTPGHDEIRSFNSELSTNLVSAGWMKDYPLSVYSRITISSVYEKIGLCVQTGNVARIYADMLKLQTLFTDDKINAGIFILPSKACADLIGKNVANYERFVRELTYVFSKVITIPLLIVCFEFD